MTTKLHVSGFTLIEMLIGLALMGVVLVAITTFYGQTAKLSSQAGSRADLQQDILSSQQLIAGRLRDAWYIYPTGQSFNLAGSGVNSRRNPITGMTTWTTGTHPILAVILPPKNVGAGACVPANMTGRDFCYRFFAYYPVTRSEWVSTASNSASNPGADALNSSAWVLAEYRAYFPATFAPTGALAAAPVPPTTGDANLLADYLLPATTAPTFNMFEYTPNTAGATIQGVTIRLVGSRNVSGKVMRLPTPTNQQYQLAVFPPNLGRLASQ